MPKTSRISSSRAHDSWVSAERANLGFTVVARNEGSTTVKVQRRKVDRATGDVVIEDRTREVPDSLWPYFILGYRPKA
jgi:hypothetical protein